MNNRAVADRSCAHGPRPGRNRPLRLETRRVGNGVDCDKGYISSTLSNPSSRYLTLLISLSPSLHSLQSHHVTTTMAIPKRALLLSSFAITFFTVRYAPKLALFPRSYFWNITTLFFIQLFARFGWQIIVYPLFLSPLRHLPQPSVRWTPGHANSLADANDYYRTRI